MAVIFPDPTDLVDRARQSRHGLGWLLLNYARRHELAHLTVLDDWQATLLSAFDADDLDRSTRVMAELASIVRPVFDPVRQWGLQQAVLSQTGLNETRTLQVIYGEQWRMDHTAGQPFVKVVMPVTGWFNPLAWANLAVSAPAPDPLLQALAELETLAPPDWLQRWSPATQSGELVTAPVDGLNEADLARLMDDVASGLLFSARPRAIEGPAVGITRQMAAVQDVPLSARAILQVSARLWLSQTTRGLSLPQLADQQSRWLHLTLKSWETARLHQQLQAAPESRAQFHTLAGSGV